MSTTVEMNATDEVAGYDTAQRDALCERLLQSTIGLMDIFALYIGDQLGFYEALAGGESLNSTELAFRTDTNERYAREWLEQQTVGGILEVEDATAGPKERRFRLPAAHAEVLANSESLYYMAPLAQTAVASARPLDSLLRAYRTGAGVPYTEYGADFREGMAKLNRQLFLQLLGQEWLPSIPEVHARLQAEPPARVADIGCGAGWSSIGIAQCYPGVRVDGYDLDAPSIELARANAHDAGLTDRVQFHVRDAGDTDLRGRYDLVTAFQCIHDMSNPVEALHTMRLLAGEDGVVLVADERVGDAFTPTRNDVEWMMYGYSILHCLPVCMDGCPSAQTGTVMRTDTLRHYAQQAGFSDIEVLPIEHLFLRVYRLKQ